jgi:hypothetical protein
MHIGYSGWVIRGPHSQAEFATCSDGRMKIKSGWGKFISNQDLKAGLVVLIMFRNDERGFVNMSLDFLYVHATILESCVAGPNFLVVFWGSKLPTSRSVSALDL